MDLRDDTHTQLKDHIATLRVMAKQKPPSQLVHDEQTRYFEQAALLLEVFVLPSIKETVPYLDLRSGVLGNAHKVSTYEPAPERSDLEVHADDSTTSLVRDDDPTRRFLAQGNGAKP